MSIERILIPHVHPDYVQINHCINNLNEIIWEIAKGRNVCRVTGDTFAFLITGVDISDNVVSVVRIEGNLQGKQYTLTFSDTSTSYDSFTRNKSRGYLELRVYNDVKQYIFTDTKDSRDFNTDQEGECAAFITQLCNRVRVVKVAPPYSHKWKKNNEKTDEVGTD